MVTNGINDGRKMFYNTRAVTRRLKKIAQFLENVAKTVAKISKIKLKIQNICIQLLLNIKINTKICF
jgi:hypothetical protein